ncbi:MAG: glycosyltransferase family 9 protein [Panacagrimonas sp.]
MTSPAPVPQRILIIRVSALGDIVFCTSLLEGLRNRYPRAHIAWLVQAGFAGIIESDSRLDEVIRLPPAALSSWDGLRATHRQLRTMVRYDWVIDAQGLLKTRLLARMVPAKRRIGFASREPGAFLLHQLVDKGGDIADISSEYRFLARTLTGTDPGAPHAPPEPPQRLKALDALAAAKIKPGFIALCPFTTRPQKHWVESHWGELTQLLSTSGAPPCVLFGGPGDVDASQRIMASLAPGSVSLVGKTPLPLLPALLEQAALVVGVDTGLTHIGIAVRRPVIALFGSTCPYTRGADSPLRVMYDALPCAPCKRHPTCGGAFTCMRGLTPARVAAAADELLARA